MRQHPRPTSAVARRLLAPLLVSGSLVAALLSAVPAQAVTTIAKINFQPTTFTTPAGYTADNGLAYTAARGFGWVDQNDSNPLDMTANMRSGNSIPPAYLKVSEMMMQPKGLASGRWEYAIANGTYNVTLTVGDARMSSGTNYCCLDGTFRLSVEGIEVVNDYVATPAAPLHTASANIAVSDGKLTIDAAGGVNTKLDHVEITTATGPAQGTSPQITGVTPAAGATQVAVNTSVSLALSEPVLPSSVTAAHLTLTGPSGVVPGTYNAGAAGATASFTPSSNLAVNSVYTLNVTGLVAASGPTFAPFASTFTTAPASTVNNGAHVNFQPASVTAPAGYVADTGAAFNGQTGWQDLTGAPVDLTANTRVAHAAASPDARFDTDLLMQAASGSGNTTPGRWATTLPNGSYDVSVTVGDPLAVDSTDEIIAQPGTANAVTVIDHYVPSAASPWQTITKRVTVTNGLLVLSPSGGTNTKIDFVDAVPATTDTLSPTVTLSLAGSLSSGTTYSGPVTVSASSVDNVGVTSTTYVLDAAASAAYSVPVVVSAPGSHTITVTAKDAAGNPGVATKTFSIAAASGTGSLHVNFAAQTSAAFAGYTTDYGAAFTVASGSGWEDQSTGAPLSAIGNGRERSSALSPDKRYDTLVQMQETAASNPGTHTAVRWEHALPNGTYSVTVAVGDATATNSVDTITAEPGTANSTVIINAFQATSGTLFQTITKTVTVSDGFLTLSAAGGSNTKIDYVDAVPETVADGTPPTATITLAGTLTTGTTYSGPVSASTTFADNVGGSGVASVTYSVDGGASAPYTAAVPFTTGGPHVFAVTVKDAAGNLFSTSSSFSIVQPDTTRPSATITLAGTPITASSFSGSVTASATYSDNVGGSGVASVTYSLDGGPTAPYTAGVLVTTSGLHTFAVTVTDVAANVFTTEADFSIVIPDTTKPTLSVALNGMLNAAATAYLGDVTADVTADDQGGSGLASTTYVLDSDASLPVNGTIAISGVGTHTLTVTATDGAGNFTTDVKQLTIEAPPVDTTAPTGTLDLTGVGGPANFTGDVTATLTAADEPGGSGLAPTTYVLDSNPSLTWAGPLVVTDAGDHTLVVTLTDNANNSLVLTKTWHSDPAPVDTTDPTVSLDLSGTTGGVGYIGDVTATAMAADEAGGSGLATTTYTLDAAASIPYTAPVVVSAAGHHTMTVTATDGAGNFATATQTWDSELVDTTPPTVTFALSGLLYSGTTYGGNVTASAAATDLGSGIDPTATTYVLDSSASASYTAPIVVTGTGPHTFTVTAHDRQGNTDTEVATWTQVAPDTTPPTPLVSLTGTKVGGTYVGSVTANLSATDTGTSGLSTATYVLDSGLPQPMTATVAVPGSGSHTLTLTATDNAGNTNTATQSWTSSSTDTTAPTVSVALTGTLYSGTTYGGNVTVTITAADNPGGSGLAPLSYVLDGTTSAYTGPFVVSTTISHSLSVTATDNQNNSSAPATKSWSQIAVDNIKPTASVSLAGTKQGTTYIGDVTATLAATDADSGIASATYVLDTAAAKAISASPVVVSAAGTHSLTITATDHAGNTITVVQSWTSVAIDGTAPTVSVALSGTLYSGTTYGGNVTVTITAADNVGGSGLAPVSYVLDGTTKAYTAPFTVTALGSHTFSVTVSDNQNNTAAPVAKAWSQITADTTKPTATISLSGNKPASTYLGDVTATLAAADNAGGSGLASATYVLDNAAAKAVTAAPVTVSAAGSHTLTITAVDNAGNTTVTAQTWTSQLADTVKPTVTIALAGALYSGTKYGGSVTVTLTATDNPGGSGIAATSYVLDGAASATYTGPFVVSTTGNHTLAVTTSDNQGNTSLSANAAWSEQTPDVTKPAAAASLAGAQGSGGIYTGSVTITVTSSDEVNGSGLKTTTYSLDGGGATAYTVPVVVSATGSHTLVVTATDNAGNVGTATTAWNQGTSSGTAKLVVTSPDDAVLANPSTPRLVFSAVRSFGATPAKAFTFTNNGTGTLLVSNLAIGGANANNWKLDVGQPTSLSIGAGGTATVRLLFTPTDPAGCASTASPYAIGDVDRNATLTYTTNDATAPAGSALLSGVNACYVGGNNEPVLDQLLPELGYTDVVDTQFIDHRYIGPLRYLQGTDEIQSPYFTVANAAQPVSVVPIAHYGSASATPYQATGYYAFGSAMTSPKSACSSACHSLWQFPADTIVGSNVTYNQDQKLLPGVIGGTTFTGTGTFGFFSGDYSDVNFSDDSLNIGHDKSNNPLPVPHYTHGMRVFPAYGPGHVVIPNTYIIGIDLSRVPAYKNNDYQDIILLVRNVQPALTQGPLPGAATTDTLTTAGTVSPTCQVTGFDGVLANTAGNQCNAANIAFTQMGLRLTSTAGQLANSNQQNALYKTFDATHNQFTVDAKIVGPLSQIATDFQQVGVFFGPDQKNFVKAEVDSEGSTPHLTMFYSEKGVTGTVGTIALPAVKTASTIDLIITGNGNLPDPLPFGDTYGVHGFPLDQLSISYSLNGATPVAVGSVKAPADVTGWFSRQAKAGILVSNSGTTTPIAVTFSRFAITAP